MKRINLGSQSLITSDSVADALLEYATQLNTSVAVEVPVLEANGVITMHDLLIGPSSQWDIADVDGLSQNDEDQRFAVPQFPRIGGKAAPDSGDAGDADETVLNFDEDPFSMIHAEPDAANQRAHQSAD